MRWTLASGFPHTTGMVRGRVGRVLGLTAALMAMALLSLAACGQANAGPALASDQTFVWPLQQEASVKDETFDPTQISTAYDFSAAQMLYSGLVTLGQNLTVQDDLAQSHDISSDGLTYTFHLYPGLKFSDGTPLTSKDFAYSINRTIDPCTQALSAGTPQPVQEAYYLSPIKDFATFNSETCVSPGSYTPAAGQTGKALTTLIGDSLLTPDSQTLVIKLGAPAAYFLEALTYPTSFPVEQSLVNKYPGGQWVMHLDQGGVSGPFMVGSYSQTYNNHAAVVYVPNPYWKDWHEQGRTVRLAKIIRPYIANADTMYQEYRQGAYDYTDVPSDDYPYARGQQDFNEVNGLEIQAFWIQVQQPPFDNQDVRQALDLALNKQLMADRICQGGCIPTNHTVPQGMQGYNPGLTNPTADGTQSVTGNQAAALKLMQQAVQTCHGPNQFPPDHDYCAYIDAAHYGTALKPIDVYVATTSATRLEFTNAAVQQWNTVFQSSLGITVQTQQVDSFGTLIKNVLKGNYGMFSLGWIADYPDPQDWTSNLFMSTSGNNFSHLADAALDKLMQQADQDPNPVTRMLEYNKIEQQLVETVPWIPYEQAKLTWRQRSWVQGFALNATGSFADVSWPSVYITQH